LSEQHHFRHLVLNTHACLELKCVRLTPNTKVLSEHKKIQNPFRCLHCYNDDKASQSRKYLQALMQSNNSNFRFKFKLGMYTVL